jgi:UDP:flavonoid glycosyltransferase YjiC (YdhE family)
MKKRVKDKGYGVVEPREAKQDRELAAIAQARAEQDYRDALIRAAYAQAQRDTDTHIHIHIHTIANKETKEERIG